MLRSLRLKWRPLRGRPKITSRVTSQPEPAADFVGHGDPRDAKRQTSSVLPVRAPECSGQEARIRKSPTKWAFSLLVSPQRSAVRADIAESTPSIGSPGDAPQVSINVAPHHSVCCFAASFSTTQAACISPTRRRLFAAEGDAFMALRTRFRSNWPGVYWRV